MGHGAIAKESVAVLVAASFWRSYAIQILAPQV